MLTCEAQDCVTGDDAIVGDVVSADRFDIVLGLDRQGNIKSPVIENVTLLDQTSLHIEGTFRLPISALLYGGIDEYLSS